MSEEIDNKNSGLPYLFAEETLYDSIDENILVSFEGKNKKGIVLLFNNSLTEKLSGTEKDIITRMLNGLKSSMEDVAVVNLAFADNISFGQLMKQFRFRLLAAFDISPFEIKLNIETPLYQTIQFGNGKLLFCDSLIVIDKEKNTKLKFWQQFSPFFSSQ